jgi:hypothetical protein
MFTAKRYDEKAVTARREAVRRALNDYKAELRKALDSEPRGSGQADNEFDHIKACITQTESAKRVLYMED